MLSVPKQFVPFVTIFVYEIHCHPNSIPKDLVKKHNRMKCSHYIIIWSCSPDRFLVLLWPVITRYSILIQNNQNHIAKFNMLTIYKIVKNTKINPQKVSLNNLICLNMPCFLLFYGIKIGTMGKVRKVKAFLKHINSIDRKLQWPTGWLLP